LHPQASPKIKLTIAKALGIEDVTVAPQSKRIKIAKTETSRSKSNK
jgi:hypothetical protein